MGKLYDRLMQDYRMREGLKACINCGTCTAICPAAEFYKYDPRQIVDIVQSKDDAEIEGIISKISTKSLMNAAIKKAKRTIEANNASEAEIINRPEY